MIVIISDFFRSLSTFITDMFADNFYFAYPSILRLTPDGYYEVDFYGFTSLLLYSFVIIWGFKLFFFLIKSLLGLLSKKFKRSLEKK